MICLTDLLWSLDETVLAKILVQAPAHGEHFVNMTIISKHTVIAFSSQFGSSLACTGIHTWRYWTLCSSYANCLGHTKAFHISGLCKAFSLGWNGFLSSLVLHWGSCTRASCGNLQGRADAHLCIQSPICVCPIMWTQYLCVLGLFFVFCFIGMNRNSFHFTPRLAKKIS